jgi:hypothetical protein
MKKQTLLINTFARERRPQEQRREPSGNEMGSDAGKTARLVKTGAGESDLCGRMFRLVTRTTL